MEQLTKEHEFSPESRIGLEGLATGIVGRPFVITLPIHNEARRLEGTVATLERFLQDEKMASVIVLAEDGSTDSSRAICEKLVNDYSNVLFVHNGKRLGRGKAMREAWGSLKSLDLKYCMFMDADLATDLSCLKTMVAELEAGSDLVLGSRYVANSVVTRPKLRLAMSLAYNKIVRLLFDCPIHDYQCGFKGFGPKAIKYLVPMTQERSCFWDTEVCVIANWTGLRIIEIPVLWNETRYRRTPIRRLLSDMLDHGMGLVRLFTRFGRLQKNRSRSIETVYRNSVSKKT